MHKQILILAEPDAGSSTIVIWVVHSQLGGVAVAAAPTADGGEKRGVA